MQSLMEMRTVGAPEDLASAALALPPTDTSSPSLTRGEPTLDETPTQLGSDALDQLADDFGGDAVVMAVWAAVSAWWRQETNIWGHRQASLLHVDASCRIKGQPEMLPTKTPEDQAEWHADAERALSAWEAAGSPGLLETIAVTREWVAQTQQQSGGQDGPKH